ncbi:MFS transporter [Priestia megaterium]|nr:MFS transporter [Priestia megaterium]
MSTFMLTYICCCVLVLLALNFTLLKKPSASSTDLYENEPSSEPVKVGRILFVLLFGMFIVILNQTSLNVALPIMMNDLNVSTTTAQWLITGFMLVNGVLIPISAYLVGRFGFRKLFITAMVCFTLGSLICAISHSFTLMMIGRIIQAIGAGILMPLGMNIFMTIFPPEKRGAAMGIMGIAMILAPAIGPTLTGWIIQHHDWNIIFYGMTAIGLIDTLFAVFWFKIPHIIKKAPFDLVGVIFSCIGFGSVLYGFSEAGSKGWDSAVVILTLTVGLLFIALFSWRQLISAAPLLELRVLKYKIFTFTILINSIVTMSLFGAMLLLPIYLQNIRGFTPLESGLLLLPGALIMGVMGPIAGKIFDKFGIRILAVVGMIITTIATWEFTHLTNDTPYHVILGYYSLRSFGMSLIMMPIMTAGMNALPLRLIPHGTAMSNTVRQVAGSIGTAILVTVMTTQTSAHLADYTNNITSVQSSIINELHDLSQTIEGTAHLPTETSQSLSLQLIYSQAAKSSTIHGINDAFMVATLLSLVALVLAFFLKTPKLNTESGDEANSTNTFTDSSLDKSPLKDATANNSNNTITPHKENTPST